MKRPETSWGAQKLNCQACSREVAAVPLVVGEPTPALEDQALRGEVVLWGSVPTPWRWACPDCRSPISSLKDRWNLDRPPVGLVWEQEPCPVCNTSMVWSHASWRCSRCRYKDGCC